MIEFLTETVQHSWAILITSALLFFTQAITIFDIRILQFKRVGRLPPDHPKLPKWTIILHPLEWVLRIILLILNWKFALLFFLLLFILKVLPVLELIGSILMAPFKPRNVDACLTAGSPGGSRRETPPPFYQWVELWLQTDDDLLNIEDCLDSYIAEYDLPPSIQDESEDLADRRTRCILLKSALEDAQPPIRESIEEHLRKSEDMLVLYKKRDEMRADSDAFFAERRAQKGYRHQTESDDSPTELDAIYSEMERIHQGRKAGTISPKDGIRELDELEERVDRLAKLAEAEEDHDDSPTQFDESKEEDNIDDGDSELEFAAEMLLEFRKVLIESMLYHIVDEERLPCKKHDLKSAIKLLICHFDDEQRKEALREAFHLLAKFQQDSRIIETHQRIVIEAYEKIIEPNDEYEAKDKYELMADTSLACEEVLTDEQKELLETEERDLKRELQEFENSIENSGVGLV